jgi:DNA helicase-2/ATP-dependent DNA helicase PcrA
MASKANVINRWKWLIEKDASRIIDSNERNIYIEEEMKLLSFGNWSFCTENLFNGGQPVRTIIDILKRIKEYISSTDNPIKLSTIHRAKGLENERVFILNYDKLPFIRLHQKDWEMIQEVNLKYVAITRTLHELVLIEEIKEVKADDSGNLFDTMPF